MSAAAAIAVADALCRRLSPFQPSESATAEEGVDPSEVLRLAGRHRLEPALAWALERGAELALAPHEALYLEGALRRNRAREARLRDQTPELIQALNAAGIEPVLVKGIHDLVEAPGERAGRRSMTDLDLLVPREQLQTADRVVKALGYENYVERHEEYFGHHLPSLHRRGDPGAIELHFEVATGLGRRVIPADEIFEQAIRHETAGLRYFRMSDVQRLIHTITHVQISDRFHYRFMLPLRGLDDFAQLVGRVPPVDWHGLVEHFRTRGAEVECGAFLVLAHRLFGWPWPFDGEPPRAWSRHARRTLGALRLPPGVVRAISRQDELRHGFSRPVLERRYPDLESAGAWALRRHHCAWLLRRYRGKYLERLTSPPRA